MASELARRIIKRIENDTLTAEEAIDDELAEVRKALEDYGHHYLSCPQSKLKPWMDKRRDCTCGLDDALASMKVQP